MKLPNMQFLRPIELSAHIEGNYSLLFNLFSGGGIKGKPLLGELEFRGKICQFYDDLDKKFVDLYNLGFWGKIHAPGLPFLLQTTFKKFEVF